MTDQELKAWRKARKAARRAVVREAMLWDSEPEKSALPSACKHLREIEAQAPKGESDE